MFALRNPLRLRAIRYPLFAPWAPVQAGFHTGLRLTDPYRVNPVTAYDPDVKRVFGDLSHPEPIRDEFTKPLVTTKDLENLDLGLDLHRQPESWADKFAYYTVRTLRKPTDWFFRTHYVHRAVMLETVAAVPGMVAGMLRHLKSLRSLRHDGGWIHHLLAEAENERMHLMIWMNCSQPNFWERALVTAVQGVFFTFYGGLYLTAPRVAHRIVGYLEEEAMISYTHFLKEIDNGHIENRPAPPIAIQYYHLPSDARLRDVVLAVRADEAKHRDVNHCLADRILLKKEDLRQELVDQGDHSAKTVKGKAQEHA